MPITVPNDAVATVPLVFEDQVGRVMTTPPPDGTVTSSDGTVLTAVMSGADHGSVVLTPVGPTGTVNVVYTGGGLTVTESVVVVAPVVTSVAFDETAVTFAAKGA